MDFPKYGKLHVYSPLMLSPDVDTPIDLYRTAQAAADAPGSAHGRASVKDGTVIHKGPTPSALNAVHRCVFVKDGRYVAATDWYDVLEDAVEERDVLMRKGSYDPADGIAAYVQSGIIR